MTVKTRMAPSPTGEYHIGHIRTVLYNLAFARKNKGEFVMRIEDTDRKRFVEGTTERILDVIKDYGLEWDGEPVVQSERLKIYKEYALELVEKGTAYHCFCTAERLDELRKDQQSRGLPVTKYDKKCLKLSEDEVKEKLDANEDCVIRLNVPENRNITFTDEVYGEITINSNALDDQILLKSDGYPSYHLAVVIDDNEMEITHIMRGNDWIPSTPKHVLLYEAFGWDLPKYIHLPNLKEQQGTKKLSKRFGPVNAAQFLEEGYLPEALLNFLMFLGWNPGTEEEIFSLNEFIAEFSVERIHKTDLVSFDREKLLWTNGAHIREMETKDLLAKINDWASKFKVELTEVFLKDGENILKLVQERLKKFDELPELISYFYSDPKLEKELLTEFGKDKTKGILSNFLDVSLKIENWTVENLDNKFHEVLEKSGYKPKEAFMSVRVAVTGQVATPPLFEVLEVLGKETVGKRLDNAVNMLN